MTEITDRAKKEIYCYSVLHFLNDLHATTLPNVLPILRGALSLSLAQSGILNAVFGAMHFFGQPVAGYLADGQNKPWFAVWGPLLCAFSLFLLPSAPNFSAAFLLCAALGLGTALFHPQGNGRTGVAAQGENQAAALAVFTASGSFATAFGPAAFLLWLGLLGKKYLPLMTFPVFLICLALWKKLSQTPFEPLKREGGFKAFYSQLKKVFLKIFDIFAISSLRDVVFQGVKVFLPMLIILRGGTHAKAAGVIFFVTLSVAFANLIGGKLASKLGEDRLIFTTTLLAPIFGITGIALKNSFGTLMLMGLFGMLEASAPATISLAQKKCQDARSTASSIASGTSWGVANLAAYPVGAAADKIGLSNAMYIVTLLPWLISAWYLFAKRQTKWAK